MNHRIRFQSLALLPLMFTSLSGCRAESFESAATISAPLAVQVSKPFDVESYPTEFYTSSPKRIAMACGSVRCLAAYWLRLADDSDWILATRIDSAGNAMDAPRIQIARGNWATRVLARDDEFLVLAYGTETGTAGPIKYYRVRGSDGAVTPVVADGLPTATSVIGASACTTWMLISPSETNGKVEAQIHDVDSRPIGEGVLFSAYIDQLADPIPGSGQYLLADRGQAVRIGESTGQALDAEPIVVSQYYRPAPMRGVFADGIYQFALG